MTLQCRICASPNTRLFTKKNGFDVYRCLRCRLLFVWPLPAPPDNLYSDDYFAGAKKGYGYVDYDQDKKAMESTFQNYLDKLESFGPSKGSLLDVGAATGFFINLAKQRGWEVQGVEISAFAAAKGREKGLEIRAGTLRDANFSPETFHAITLIDVIEHVTDPEQELILIRKLLKPGGHVLINASDAGSFFAWLLGKKWQAIIPPEHLTIFNLRNIETLLGRHGFEIVYKGKIGRKFTLQYLAGLAGNWSKIRLVKSFAEKLKNNAFGKLSLPLNLRDNFVLIARKN